MATFNDITLASPVDETLVTVMNSYDAVDRTALPNQNDSMSAYVLASMADLRKAVDTYNRRQVATDTLLSDAEIVQFKDGVEDSFYDVKTGIKPANEYFWENGTYDKMQIQALLTQYASGYFQYTQLCNGSAPVVAVANWNKTNSDATINCAGLVTSQKDIEYIVGASFAPAGRSGAIADAMPDNNDPYSDFEAGASVFDPNKVKIKYSDDPPKIDNPYLTETVKTSVTANSLHLQFAAGALNLHETKNLDALDIEPFPTDTATLGWYAPLKEQDLFSQVPWGGPRVGLTYSHTADGDFAAGSERFLVAAVAGYKQPLYRFDLGPVKLMPYLTPQFTAGYSQSKLNFGQGTVPASQDAMIVGAAAQAGIEVCRDKLGCLAAFYQYQYDTSVFGEPHYQSFGGSAGIELSVALPDLTKRKE